MKRAVIIIYATVCYIAFACSLLYLIGFLNNIGVPKSIDTGAAAGEAGASMSLLQALIIDAGLIGLFGLQHSVMARKGFKRWWTKLVPSVIERSTYVLFASAMLILLFWQWRPMPALIWQVDHVAGRLLVHALFCFGVALFVVSTCLIDHLELFGLKQAYCYFVGRKPSQPVYKTPFLYKLMRHPLILGLIIVFWSTPDMSVGHLVLAAGMTAYCFIGVFFEERDLVRSFGDSYRAYQRSTPMLLPIPSRRGSKHRGRRVDRYA